MVGEFNWSFEGVEGLVSALDESAYLHLFISCLEGPRGDESYVCRVPAASLPSPPAPWTPGGHGAGGAGLSGIDCGELWSAVGQNVLGICGQVQMGVRLERMASHSVWGVPSLRAPHLDAGEPW